MALLGALTAHAGVKEQAKRMHDRLAGVPPSNTVLEDMAAKLTAGQTRAAADVAMANPNFLKVTVKNMVIPWTNKDMTVFYPFNDAAATLVGMVRDGVDFRRAMYDDIIYVGAASLGLPAYSNSNNDHYAQMESRNIDLNSTNLLQRSQSSTTGLASTAVSGVLTTRQSARAFFYAGTNRRMLRFTFINYMCKDLENVKDTSRIPDRIRQDVARSPGGDSSVFLNTCIGCHAGMDGLAGAFANYQWNYDTNNDPDGNNGNLVYTPGIVQPKYLINSTVFKYGYVTTDDSWINRWRTGPNANLGWGWANNSTQQVPTTGNGMQSFGQEIANSLAFSRCQAIKVYKTVCFNEPTETTLGNLVTSFKNSGYDMKQIFADAAIDCRGN
ncbi:MAG: hypothetical protein HY080_13825 [Gammaproteobacteria bacterium]|nr:hypothetical protein [Gammaproteobacteria bacterium]